MLATFERPLSPSLTFSTAGANVKFRRRPVARRENRRWLQWVASGYSAQTDVRRLHLAQLSLRFERQR